MKNITFELMVKTQRRLHISAATSAVYDPKRGTVYRYARQGKGLFPCTVTKSIPVLLRDESGEVGTAHVPIIPATTLRGILRRVAAGIIEESLLAKGQKISHDLYQALHCGAAQRSLSGAPRDYEALVTSMDNIFFGVFGGGSRMTPSKLVCNDAYPCISILAKQGIAPQLAALPELVPITGRDGIRNLTMVDHIVRRDDLLLGKDPNAPRVIENYAEAYMALVTDMLKRREQQTAEEAQDDEAGPDASRAALSTLVFTEFVVPGVPFFVEISLDNATESQVGLVFKTIQAFVERGQVGGKKAVGAGRFMCSAVVMRSNGKVHRLMQAIDGTPQWDTALIEGELAAVEKTLADISPDDLESAIR
jgi:CRISPR type IV-associated protein Csf2